MLRAWPITICLAVAYFLTGYAGLMLPAAGSHITLIWLPTGIAVATLYRWGLRCWPGVMLGALAVNMAIGTSFTVSLGIAVGNTLGPLLSTGILLRSGFQRNLNRAEDIILLTAAAMVGMLMTASAGVTCLTLSGQLLDGRWSAWLIWWASDVTGVIAAAPLVLVTSNTKVRDLWARRIEFTCWVASITLATAVVFFYNGAQGPALAIAFIPFPLLAWAAIRFGPIGTSLAVIFLSFGAVIGTSAGFGPFFQPVRTDSVLTLSLFMATSAVVGWLVSALTVSKLEAVGTRQILERALEEVSLGVLVAGDDYRITYANSGFTRLTGYSEAEMLEKSCSVLQGPDTDPTTLEELRAALHGPGNFDGDILNYRKDGSKFWNALIISPILNGHGERTGFLSIQRDVTDRKLEQLVLSQSEERFRAIVELERASEERFHRYVEHAPNGVFVIDLQGYITDVNPAACRQTGFSRDELLSMQLIDLTPLEAIAESLKTFEKLNADGIVEGEQPLRCKSGTTRWFTLAAARLSSEFVMFTSDIQSLKETENALRQSRDRFEYLVASCPAVIYTTKPAGDYAVTFMSENVRSLLGYEPQQFLADPGFSASRIHPDDVARVYEGLPKLLEFGRQRLEFRFRTHSGEYRWLDDDMVLIRDASGEPREIIGYMIDITDRKRIEEALSKSEEHSRLALDAAELGIWRHFVSKDTLELDERARQILQIERTELTLEEFSRMIHPGDLARVEEERRRSAAPGSDGSFASEQRILLSDGQVRWVAVRAKIVKDEVRGPVYVLGTVQDITARRHADENLQENETRLRLALAAANQGLYDLNVQTGECLVSSEYAIMLGYDPATFRETNSDWRERLHPDDREAVYNVYSEYVAGKRDEYRVEFRLRTKAGQWKWLLSVGAVVTRTADGQPLRMLGTHTDISVRKRVEEQLQQSNAILQALANVQREFLVDAAPQSFERLLKLLLEQTESQYGFIGQVLYRDDRQPYLETHAIMNIAGDDATRALYEHNSSDVLEFDDLKNLFGSVMRSRQAVVAHEPGSDQRRGELPPGQPQLRAFLGLPLFHGAELIGMVGMAKQPDAYDDRVVESIQPILATCAGLVLAYRLQSDQLKAAAALRESEEQLRIFVENAPVGVAMLDRELRYLSYSRRWLTDYGLGEQSLIGRSHYEVFPEISCRWKEIYRRCLTGVSERCEQDRFERADGTADDLRWEIQPWTDATGAIGGLVFFTESITEQVNAQEQLRDSLREKESMLKEIHHRVKNNLQVISSLLSLQAASVTQPDALDVLTESQNRVRAMALVHETLYRSHDLADVDLSRYLGDLCRYLFRSYGVDAARVRLDLDVEAVDVSLDNTIPCGLLVNEIVSNSLKHAFPDNRSGNITVRARTAPDGCFCLTLADNGIGLPTDLAIDKTPSLGLRLIQILTEQIGGELTIERAEGTRFVLLFPNEPSAFLGSKKSNSLSSARTDLGHLSQPPAP